MVESYIRCVFGFFSLIGVFIYFFIFRERGREGEREGEKHLVHSLLGTWPAT